MEKKWVNYHKHTSLSHLYLKDSPLVNSDYWNVLKERYGNEPCVFTTVEHGWAGTYFRTYDEIEKFNKKNDTKIKFVFGIEGYWVKDRHSTDAANCHIILLAKNDHGRKAINKALSTANKDGYYYRARLDLELLLSLPKDDVMVTTACVAFWRYDDIDDIVLKLHNHFRDFYLEVQPHNTDKQKEINRHIVELSAKYNIPLIAGCDSHVINESQLADREDLLASSHIKYEDEEGWYMDYPTYDILVERFMQQGILSESQIIAAIENTNVIFDFEDIVLDRSLKVPVVKWLRDKTQEERNAVFEKILADEWKRQRWDIDESKLSQYQQEIKHDIAEIEACNMADYFILSYYIMKYGQEKYGGVLTPTGRGSAVGMFLNKLLGLTNVDKVTSSVLMYSERFLTKERVLETHTPPDIDNNVSDRQPFIEAQRELVGELGTYDLIALGTLKLKSAWKMYARANNVEPETANNISKQLDEYEKAKKYAEENEEIDIQDYVSQEYIVLVNGCQKYLGIIDNCKGHPCSTVAYDGDVESDIGVILCKSETTKKSVLAAVIESGTIDAFGYLKQDYLIVDSIGLIYDIYKEIGIDTLTVNQLLAKVKDDKKVWDIYANGYTQCVNQCEQEKTTAKVMRYRPQNISELTQFVASVRPSFQSMYKTFEKREHFEYGIKAFDNLLQDEFCQSSFILYQESLMKVLAFAGFAMSETYGIIKAISKKKESVIASAEQKFIEGFSKNILETGETSDIEQAKIFSESVWHIIKDSANYGYNAAHAYCMAIDSVTIAYLKAYYPLEFYKVALTRFTKKGEKDKVSKIEQELLARGFKLRDLRWGDDNRAFNIDRKDNAIIPTMTSVKDMPKTAPVALYDLYHHSNIKNRGELYAALSSLDGLNKTAIDILFKLDYFHQFGSPKRLIAEYEIFQKYMDCKVLTKSKLTDSEIEIVRQCAEKETDKQFRDLDNRKLVSLMIKNADIPSTTTLDIIRWQLEIFGHSVLRDKNFAPNFWLVQKVTTNSYGTTKIDVYNLCLGVMKTYKVSKPWFSKTPCEKGNVIQCVMTDKPKFRKDANGKYVETGEYETIIKVYKIMLDK